MQKFRLPHVMLLDQAAGIGLCRGRSREGTVRVSD